MITYNDWPTVKQTCESLRPLVDQLICVDGRYVDFGQINDSDLSTDGTLEYLESLDDVVVIEAPLLDEVHKRNCYLIGNAGDWYLHLDADEVWHGPLTLPDADMGFTPLKWRKTGNWMQRVRLFRHVDGIHYEGKHYWLKDGEGRTFARLEKPGNAYTAAKLPAENWIEHFDEDRPPERQTDKRTYFKKLTAIENAIREVN